MSCDKSNWKDSEIRKNPFFCPDKKSVKLWEKYLLAVRKAGSSCGAIIELRATGYSSWLRSSDLFKIRYRYSSSFNEYKCS